MKNYKVSFQKSDVLETELKIFIKPFHSYVSTVDTTIVEIG